LIVECRFENAEWRTERKEMIRWIILVRGQPAGEAIDLECGVGSGDFEDMEGTEIWVVKYKYSDSRGTSETLAPDSV